MKILTHPNPALKQRALEVDPLSDNDLKRLVRTMAESMYGAPGVGLAAPQVGVLKRVICWDTDDKHGKLRVLFNPRIVEASDETNLDDEGCLSVPGISVPVERPIACVCEGEVQSGDTVRIEAEELLARILQHETDHCDGILILDRAAPEERRAAIRRYTTGGREE